MQKVDCLLKNALVVTVDNNDRILPNTSIAIKDGFIHDIGDAETLIKQYDADDSIDASRLMILPGLINTHCHIAADYLTIPGSTSGAWIKNLQQYNSPQATHKPHFLSSKAGFIPSQKTMYERGEVWSESDQLTYYSSLHALYLEIAAGATCVADAAFGAEQSVVQAFLDSKLRGVATNYCYDLVYDTAVDSGKAVKARDAECELLRSEESRRYITELDDEKMSWIYSFFSDVSSSDELLTGLRELSVRDDCQIWTHSNASHDYNEFSTIVHGVRAVERLDRLGLLNNKLLGVHMAWFNDEEIKLLGDRRINISHCPTAAAIYGKGLGATKDVPALAMAGANITLGTDDKWHGDILQEGRMAHTLHKDIYADDRVFPYYYVLKMLTRNGAQGLGMGNVGQLSVGYKADLIGVNLDQPRYFDAIGPLKVFVTRGESADVVISMVSGRVLKRDGIVVAIDQEKLIADFKQTLIEKGLWQ